MNHITYEKTRSVPLYWLYVTRMVNGKQDKIVFQTRDHREQDAEYDRLMAGGAEQQYYIPVQRFGEHQKDGSIRYTAVPPRVNPFF